MKKLPIALAMASCLAFSNVMADDDYNLYHVTITNATTNHVITPPAVIAHKHEYKLFNVAQPASPELVTLAETGNPNPLLMSLETNGYVSAAETTLDQNPPVILPGHSITVTIIAPEDSYFTVAGMLATTNDAFMSATMKGPEEGHHTHGMAMTYDAGSEDNNEKCKDIPGPPCGGANNTIEGDGEGFITIHNGINGNGNLKPAMLDWRGPTAIVKIHNAGEID